jgi:hypothetical protein
MINGKGRGEYNEVQNQYSSLDIVRIIIYTDVQKSPLKTWLLWDTSS